MRSADTAIALTDAQRRAADAGLKAMMPIEGRPFLDYVLSALADAGVTTVGVVVAPDHGELRRYYQETSRPSRLAITFIVQPEPVGTANAVLAAEAWTRGQPFLVMNADNLYPLPALRAVASLDEPGLPGFDRDELVRSSNIEPARLHAFALIEADAAGYLTAIVEKPRQDHASTRGMVSMNCWRFDRRIFDACRAVPRSARGEYELPEAVGVALRQGVRFKVLPALGPVLDLSQRADAVEVSRRLAGVVPRP
jgi:glucose-1-phosphate thymidylyltransferase